MAGPPMTLANTFGALEIGTMIAVCLFGIITVQTEYYFREFRGDQKWMKVLVALVWCLEVGHTVGICMEVYITTIFYNGRALEYHDFRAIGVSTLLSGIITMFVQSFFSFRAWRLLPSPYCHFGLFCIIASIARCGFSTWLAHEAITATSLESYTTHTSWLITMLLSMGVALDVLVALSMTYFFMTKRRNGLQSTARLVDRLVAFTVRTGLLTCLTAGAVLIGFQVAPNTYIWVGIYCCLAKMYTNALLSALNGRQELRKTMSTSGPSQPRMDSSTSNMSRRMPISVMVDIQTEHDIELQSKLVKWEHNSFMESSLSLEKNGGVPSLDERA